MAVETSPAPTFKAPRTEAPTDIHRAPKAVQIWAAIGAFFLVLQVYIIGSWLTSDEATPTPAGPTEMPDWMWFSLRIQEITSVIFFILTVYFFVVRPLRRDGRLNMDSAFVFAFLMVAWQDPLLNYMQPIATYNANMINLGSWTSDVPGWISPHGHLLPEPFLWSSLSYVWICYGVMVLVNKIQAKVQARFKLSALRLVLLTYAFFILLDIPAETLWMMSGIYTYAGGDPSYTLWSGNYYQLPLWEPLLFGALATAWTCMRYFRDDKGYTFAERGLDEVKASRKSKQWIRTLALAGAANVLFLFIYNFPVQIIAANGHPWPKDIQERSYFTDGLCGPGTNYHCPGPGIPLVRDDSAHVKPSGEFAPAGVKGADGNTGGD